MNRRNRSRCVGLLREDLTTQRRDVGCWRSADGLRRPHPCRLSRDRTSRVVSTRPRDKSLRLSVVARHRRVVRIGPAAAWRAADLADHRHPFLDLGESVRIRRRRRRGGLRSRMAGVGHQPDIPPASLTIRSLGSPQAHIERALPAVPDMSVLEPDDQGTEFRQRQP